MIRFPEADPAERVVSNGIVGMAKTKGTTIKLSVAAGRSGAWGGSAREALCGPTTRLEDPHRLAAARVTLPTKAGKDEP